MKRILALLLALAVPAVSQTINPNQIREIPGEAHADRFPGGDMGAKITNAAASLPTGYLGYKVGTIILPNSTTTVWSTPVVLGPGVNIVGQGKFSSNFVCTVANAACLTHDASATTGIYAHTTQANTTYSGFAIRGNGAAGQDIFYTKDAQGLYVNEAIFDGATAGSCVHMRDINWWTERNTFLDVSTGYSCAKGWRFSNDPASPYEPHPSFGYNRFLDIKANPNGAQKAFSFENDVYMYASTFRATVNKEGAGAIVFHMEGGAEFYNNETHIFGEEQGTGGAFLDITSATNILAYMGEIYFPNQVNNIHAGATLLHSVDDSGFGPPIPVTSQRGYIATTAVVIPMGDDLNNYTNCGTYEGNSLLNAPTFVGTSPITIENICSNDPRYVTQIAHLMTFTPHTPRVWVRIKDFGTWGNWVEQAFANPGVTGFLTSGPIAAGTCNVLTATVAGAQSGSTPVVTPAYSLPVTTILQVGLDWSTSYVSALNTVTVPVCNRTVSPITPAISPVFSVRLIQ